MINVINVIYREKVDASVEVQTDDSMFLVSLSMVNVSGAI